MTPALGLHPARPIKLRMLSIAGETGSGHSKASFPGRNEEASVGAPSDLQTSDNETCSAEPVLCSAILLAKPPTSGETRLRSARDAELA